MQNPLQVVPGGDAAIAYLSGAGKYADRAAWPFPFLIVSDFTMSEGDALVLLRWLADRPERKKVLVIVLGSLCPDKQMDLLYELGAKSFLLKPLAYQDMMAIIRKMKDFWIDTAISPERGAARPKQSTGR